MELIPYLQYKNFDYLVINDDFDHAVMDLKAIIRSHRLNREYQQQKHADLIAHLLQ